MEEKIREIMQVVFDQDLSEFTVEDIAPKNLPQWDSLAHLNLITSLEQVLEVEFELDDMATMMEGLASILKTLEKYQ